MFHLKGMWEVINNIADIDKNLISNPSKQAHIKIMEIEKNYGQQSIETYTKPYKCV